MIGKRINGRYEILETIGGGGMANVYKALDMILDRHVAVKVLRPQFSDDEEFIRRFHREAQAATSLSHPNIVNIYDVGEENNIYYIVMEYIEGMTLKQMIQKQGILSLEATTHIMSQITSAIAHAHENHIVHRDIKPHNILISTNGDAKVTDFGIARAITSATITHTNSVMGTVHYLSPEQARGGLVNTKSDIYSLGVVLYEMVTGKVPFSGDSAVSIAIKHLQSEIPSPKEVNPSLPQSIENIILKATVKDPFYRYESAVEMEEEIRRALDPRRINEPKFEVPLDDEATKAIPIVKDHMFEDSEATKIVTSEKKGPDEQIGIDKKPKKRRFLTVFLIILFLMIGSGIAAFMIIPKLFYVAEVEVPNVLLLEYEEAERELEQLGLLIDRIDMPNNDVDEGLVTNQDPAEGVFVKENSTVKLYVSEGKEKEEMPAIIGSQKNVAERMLKEYNFRDIKSFSEVSREYAEGVVISQIPSEGELIHPEQTVAIITYSSGLPKITLKDLRNWKKDEVEKYLESKGLKVKFKEEFNDEVLEGLVISHSPSPTATVREGDEVMVVISRGPEEKEIQVEEDYEEPEAEKEPYRVTLQFDIPIDEEEVVELWITYIDSTTTTEQTFVKEMTTGPTKVELPLIINPGDEASYFIYIDGIEARSDTIPYPNE